MTSKFPNPQYNENYFQNLTNWYNKYKFWYSNGWKIQAVVTQDNDDSKKQFNFVHICPMDYTYSDEEFNKECQFGPKKTFFIQQRIGWDEIIEFVKLLMTESQDDLEHSSFKGIVFKKTAIKSRFALANLDSFHSTTQRTPFIPAYCIYIQLEISDYPSGVIILDKNEIYRSITNAIYELFIGQLIKQNPAYSNYFENNKSFSISFPITPFKLNKASYDSQNFVINYSYDSFGKGNTCKLALLPSSRKKHFLETAVSPNTDNIIPAKYGTHLNFIILEVDSSGKPFQVILNGGMGISEKALEEWNLDKITTETIKDLCKQGENQYIEFKSDGIISKEGRSKLLLEIAAFANTNPGLLLIGVGDEANNKGEILGIAEAEKRMKKNNQELVNLIVENWRKDFDPVPEISGRLVRIEEFDCDVIVIKIDYDEQKLPITVNGKVVRRVTSSVHPASQAEIKQLTKEDNPFGLGW